jgi:hypothetical protein
MTPSGCCAGLIKSSNSIGWRLHDQDHGLKGELASDAKACAAASKAATSSTIAKEIDEANLSLLLL